jgi:hypothetical protein
MVPGEQLLGVVTVLAAVPPIAPIAPLPAISLFKEPPDARLPPDAKTVAPPTPARLTALLASQAEKHPTIPSKR